MSIILYPYKKGLRSTVQLRDQGCKIRYPTSNVRQGVACAWGMQTAPPWSANVTWINPPSGVRSVSNKMEWAGICHSLLAHSYSLQYTSVKHTAEEWARGGKVVCRTVLNGSGGKGIVIARSPDQLVDAPLYSKYFAKQREYRVIFSWLDGEVYTASKRLRPNTDLGPDDLLIRTMDKGYVYQTEPEGPPDIVLDALRHVADQLYTYKGLTLLAYDVAYNTERDEARIIEANTAWGMNSYTAEKTYQAMLNLGEHLS